MNTKWFRIERFAWMVLVTILVSSAVLYAGWSQDLPWFGHDSNGLTKFSVSATGTITQGGNLSTAGYVTIGSGTPGTAQGAGDLYVTDGLEVDGAVDMGSTVTVGSTLTAYALKCGSAGVPSVVQTEGSGYFSSTLEVDGATRLDAALTCNSTAGFNGATTFSSTVALNNANTLGAAATLVWTNGAAESGTKTSSAVTTNSGAITNTGTVTNNNTVTFASEVRDNSTNHTGKLSWLTTGNTASIAGLTLSDSTYIVILEDTDKLTNTGFRVQQYVSARAGTGFTITNSCNPTSDVSQRYWILQGDRL